MAIRNTAPDALAIILGGGRGTRLHPLTKRRAKPAVPLGGHYRLIDVPVSNCLNSGLDRIFVLTQFNSASLNRHVSNTYKLDIFSRGFVEILAAQQTTESEQWFQGTADAVRQNLPRFRSREIDLYLILAGDHLYRMDYRRLIAFHQRKKADITVSVLPVNREAAAGFGILKTDENGRIVRFVEKPKDPDVLNSLVWRESKRPGEERYLASMGVYLFQRDVLEELLKDPKQFDFGKDVFPSSIDRFGVYGYPFWGYWEDIGTIKTYYDANMALTSNDPPFNFHSTDFPIYTRPRFLPPARILQSDVTNSVVSAGAFIDKASVTRSLIGLRSMIREGTNIRDSIIIGADYYESDKDIEKATVNGHPLIGIGKNTSIERAIIDKNARIGDGVQIKDHSGEPDQEGKNYLIRDGIVIVEKDALIEPGTVI